MKRIIQNIRKKWITKTIMTLVLIAIIIAIFIGINFLVRKLDIQPLDITKDKIFTLSTDSIDKTKNINNDVVIYCIGLNEYENVFNVLEQYSANNEKIKYEKIENVTDRPDLVSSYGLTDNTQAIIVEASDERNKVLTINDLYTYNYDTYEEIDLTEEAITNAIMDVTIENKPNIYFVTGHNLYEIDNYMNSLKLYLSNEANEVNNLDLLAKGAIPEDCDVLIITTLKEDFTDYEKEAILAYINKGGQILVLSDPLFIEQEYANFNEILKIYGVSIQTNAVVFEQDDDKMIANSPELIRPIVNEDSEITKYLASDIGTCFIDATRLNFIDSEELSKQGIEVQNLVTSGENSFLRTDLTIDSYEKTSKDLDAGNSVLGALVSKKITVPSEQSDTIDLENNEQIDESTETEKTEEITENKDEEDAVYSQLIIFANNIFATDMPIPLNDTQQLVGIQFYNNKDLVLNSISYLSKRQDTLIIRKNTSAVIYTATELENNIITAIIVAFPILVIITGIVVWQIRRRK